jgi:hypothetical protein
VIRASWGGVYADERRLWTGWLARDGSGVVACGAGASGCGAKCVCVRWRVWGRLVGRWGSGIG